MYPSKFHEFFHFCFVLPAVCFHAARHIEQNRRRFHCRPKILQIKSPGKAKRSGKIVEKGPVKAHARTLPRVEQDKIRLR